MSHYQENSTTASEAALFFITCFSGYYVINFLFSPVYILTLVGIFLSAAALTQRKKIKKNPLIIITLSASFYLALSQLIFLQPNISTVFSLLFCFLVFLSATSILPYIKTNKIISISFLFIYISIPLLVFESYYRIGNPKIPGDLTASQSVDLDFYAYKFNSVMLQDSNFVALFILVLIFFWLYLQQIKPQKKYWVVLFLFVLLIATISRASIFTALLFIPLYKSREAIYKYRFFVFATFPPALFLVFPILEIVASVDGSFLTKLDLLKSTANYLSSADLKSLALGVGVGNAEPILGRGSHNIFVFYLVETGLLGFSLVSLLWVLILFKSNYKAGVVMFPFLLSSMSLTSTAIPYLYVSFAIILELERRKRNELKNK